MSDFEPALAVVLEHEGGFTAGLHDPGGPTKYGISLRYLRALGADIDGDGDIDAADIKAMTAAQAADFYRVTFWDPGGFETLRDQQVATKVFDTAVNVGPRRADRLAFQACGIPVGDTRWPPYDAINAMDPTAFLKAVGCAQAAFYRALAAEKPSLQEFLAGWMARASWPFHPIAFAPSTRSA